MVEAQHVASTMKIVDDADEQMLLEALLDASKPPLANATAGLDYLLASPFRYPPRHGGSRFRDANAPGVFYGAQHVRTACAELGYWRWKFLQDAVDLSRIEPVAHAAFSVDVSAPAVDLRVPPFDRDAAVWMHPAAYPPCQEFAAIARGVDLGCIVYQSVRDPQKAWCVAVLTPEAFATAVAGIPAFAAPLSRNAPRHPRRHPAGCRSGSGRAFAGPGWRTARRWS
mgnify:CR=1 FL=1